MSIFVNPTQFLPGEDLAAYPRPFDADVKLLTNNGVDYLFAPSVDEMYSPPPFPPHATFVEIVGIDTVKEGSVRPGHFRGVATVVTKLCNIIQPDVMYFGQKDGIQTIVVQRMVRELNVPVHIEIVPTSREADGLARSSRNIYLSKTDRQHAPQVYQALLAGQRLYDQGERDVQAIKAAVEQVIERYSAAHNNALQLQYVSVASMMSGAELSGKIGEEASHSRGSTPSAVSNQHTRALLSIAVKVGRTRLIDNVILGASGPSR